MTQKPTKLLEHFELSCSDLDFDSDPKNTLTNHYVPEWISLGYFHPVKHQSQVSKSKYHATTKSKHVAKGPKKGGSTCKHHQRTFNNVNHTCTAPLASSVAETPSSHEKFFGMGSKLSTSMETKSDRRLVRSFDMDRFLIRSKKLAGCSKRHDPNEMQLCSGRRCIRPFDMDRFLARSKKLAGCSKRHD